MRQTETVVGTIPVFFFGHRNILRRLRICHIHYFHEYLLRDEPVPGCLQ